jgi:hypothetical protein
VTVSAGGGPDLGAGNGIEVKDRRRLPAELLVKFKAATGRQPRGECTPGSAFNTPSCVRKMRSENIYALACRFSMSAAIVNSVLSFVSEARRTSDIQVIISAYRTEKSAMITYISSVIWPEGLGDLRSSV